MKTEYEMDQQWPYPTSQDWRNMAEKWDTVAHNADVDKDPFWCVESKKKAANMRQRARIMEVDKA